MNIKMMIAEKEEARMEKQVEAMNGKKKGRKKLTVEEKKAKQAKYAHDHYMRQKAAKEAAKTAELERELTAKALLNDQSAKADDGKPQLSLVPMDILTAIARVREYGNRKYHSPDNWKNVSVERYRDALLRHMVAYVNDPKGVDKESGLKHRDHMACNMAFLIALEG